MLKDYYIVNKEILPEVFHKVMEAKQLLNTGQCTQVSEAVKEVGISRSAFYKYKDAIFEPEQESLEKKALIAFNLSHEKGLLSKVLNSFSAFQCNVLTINQNIPVQNRASVVICLDISDMNQQMSALIDRLENIHGVSKVNLLSIE